MSLTIIKRPLGHKLNETFVDAVIIDDGTGDVLVYTSVAHGISDGDYVYIESNFDSYNGFFYVDSIAYDSFKIKESEESDFVEFVQDATIQYRTSVLQHGWQAVHLPIVYELESDLWPNNVAEESYTPNNIVSFEDYNGYVKLNLETGIDDATARNWIELVGSEDLAGPYQIIQVLEPWALVINLAYDSGYDFSSYQVVNYYNNYAINVEVWAGLSDDHRWEARKPYELAATLKFIPDSDGRIKFSISDILKGYITTRNNLTLDTLPNNLDFHVSFYIKYYESYDESDGEEITTFEGTVTGDSFEGHAVNSAMPFKSLNSGHMSDYLNESDFLGRWLTLVDRPLLIVDRFFDISFLLRYSGVDVVVTIYKSLNDIVTETEVITIENPGLGVIRVPIIPASGFDQYCLQAVSGPYLQPAVPALNTWTQVAAGIVSWSLGSNPSYFAAGANVSHVLRVPYSFIVGLTYEFSYNVDVTISGTAEEMQIGSYLGSGLNLQDYESVFLTTSGNKTGVITIMPTMPMSYLAIRLTGAPSSISFDINSITENSADIGSQVLTEQICCDVVDECSPTFVNDLLRLTEASQLRELE